MSQDVTYTQINELAVKKGYTSVNLRLVLIKEENRWKVFLAHAIFGYEEPGSNLTRLRQDDLVIEDFSISVEEFNKFLEYLKRVNVSSVNLDGNKVIVNDEVLYKIGTYKLCFVGNMASNGLVFIRREHGKYQGIDKPLYTAQYSMHPSVTATSYQRIDVTGHDEPFTGVIDAVNHYWGTNYEQFSIPQNFVIYMPVYEASISTCHFEKDKLIVNIDVDAKRTKPEDLSVGIIVEKRFGDYRKKLRVNDGKVIFDIGFDPSYAQLFLNNGKEKLDEYYYTSSSQNAHVNQVLQQTGAEIYPRETMLMPEIKNNDANTRNFNPIFKGRNFTIEPDLCFVLMPFRSPFTEVFEKHIKPTLKKCGFKVMKADDIFKSTPIVEDIWEHINKAGLIIADVTGKNPNVFYELGIVHTVGTEVIIITQKEKDIPFDLKHYRHFRYENNQQGLSKLRDNLKKVSMALIRVQEGDTMDVASMSKNNSKLPKLPRDDAVEELLEKVTNFRRAHRSPNVVLSRSEKQQILSIFKSTQKLFPKYKDTCKKMIKKIKPLTRPVYDIMKDDLEKLEQKLMKESGGF